MHSNFQRRRSQRYHHSNSNDDNSLSSTVSGAAVDFSSSLRRGRSNEGEFSQDKLVALDLHCQLNPRSRIARSRGRGLQQSYQYHADCSDGCHHNAEQLLSPPTRPSATSNGNGASLDYKNEEEVEGEEPATADNSADSNNEMETVTNVRSTNNQTPMHAAGQVVNVTGRTWPGINKPGGVAIVLKVAVLGDSVKYDVKYIVGRGGEKNVDEEYIISRDIEAVEEREKNIRGDEARARILGQSTKTGQRRKMMMMTTVEKDLRTVSMEDDGNALEFDGDVDMHCAEEAEVRGVEEAKEEQPLLPSPIAFDPKCPPRTAVVTVSPKATNNATKSEIVRQNLMSPLAATTKPRKKRKSQGSGVGPLIPGLKTEFYLCTSSHIADSVELKLASSTGNHVDYRFLAHGSAAYSYSISVVGEVQTLASATGNVVFDTDSLQVACKCPSFKSIQNHKLGGKLIVCKHLKAALDSVAENSSCASKQPLSSTNPSKRHRRRSSSRKKSSTKPVSRTTSSIKTIDEYYISKSQSNGVLLQRLLKNGYGVKTINSNGVASMVDAISFHLDNLNIEYTPKELLDSLENNFTAQSIPSTFIQDLSILVGRPVSMCVIDMDGDDLQRTWYDLENNERAECRLFLSTCQVSNDSNHYDAIVRLPEGDKESLPYEQRYNERPPIVPSPGLENDAAEEMSRVPFSAESMVGGPDMGSHIPPKDWEIGDYPEFCKNIYRAWLAALDDMQDNGIDVSPIPWFIPWIPWYAGPTMHKLKIERVISLILNYCPSVFTKFCSGGHPASQLNSDGTLRSDTWGLLCLVLKFYWLYPKVNRAPILFPYRGAPTDVVSAEDYKIILQSYNNKFLKVLFEKSDKVGLMSKEVMTAMEKIFPREQLQAKVVGYTPNNTRKNAAMHPEMLHNPDLHNPQSFNALSCQTNDSIYAQISTLTNGEPATCTICSDLFNNVENSLIYQIQLANLEKRRIDWEAWRKGDYHLIDSAGWHMIMISGRRSIFAKQVKAYNALHDDLTPIQAARKVVLEGGTDHLDWYDNILELGDDRSEFAKQVKAYNALHDNLTPIQAARELAADEGTDYLDWYVKILSRKNDNLHKDAATYGTDETIELFCATCKFYKVNANADKYNEKGQNGSKFRCKTSTCDGFGKRRRFYPRGK